MRNLENIIEEAVSKSIKKVLKEGMHGNADPKITTVFFKTCELADQYGFTSQDWGTFIEMCQREQSRSVNY